MVATTICLFMGLRGIKEKIGSIRIFIIQLCNPFRKLHPTDELARFIQENKYDKKNKRLKPKAFEPRPNRSTGRLELSVCRKKGLSPQDLKGVCLKFNARATPPHIGHADLEKRDFTAF